MRSDDPRQLRLQQERLEKWLIDRQMQSNTPLADWEKDKAFLALASARWPVDMEVARQDSYKAQSARMRLRLRWEGFRLIPDARLEIEALRNAAELALQSLEGEP